MSKLMCETKIETFADHIAIVGDAAYNADLGGRSNRSAASRFSFCRRCDANLHIIALTVKIDRSAGY